VGRDGGEIIVEDVVSVLDLTGSSWLAQQNKRNKSRRHSRINSMIAQHGQQHPSSSSSICASRSIPPYDLDWKASERVAGAQDLVFPFVEERVAGAQDLVCPGFDLPDLDWLVCATYVLNSPMDLVRDFRRVLSPDLEGATVDARHILVCQLVFALLVGRLTSDLLLPLRDERRELTPDLEGAKVSARHCLVCQWVLLLLEGRLTDLLSRGEAICLRAYPMTSRLFSVPADLVRLRPL